MAQAVETRPFASFEWLLALRYLRARRKEGFISVIAGFSFVGIMLGVATLIIVLSVMNGFRKELFDKILGLDGHVVVRSTAGRFSDFDIVAKRLREISGVQTVLPVVEGQAMVSTRATANGALVRGLREDDLKLLGAISGNIRFGTLDGFDKAPSLAIGTRMANQLRVKVGSQITLTAPRGAQTPFGTAPRVKRYKIAAIFEMGMPEYDNTIIFMPLAEAQKFFNRRGAASVLEIIVDEPDRVGTMRPAILQAGGPTVYVTDWRQRNKSLFNALQVERNVMFVILTLIVLVAALNIISGLIMLVKDKSADIAILRTMGATSGSVMRVFFITGASIGIIGTIAGFAFGMLVCLNIETVREVITFFANTDAVSSDIDMLSQLPVEVDPSEVAQVVVTALVLSVMATLYPSWRASRLDPIEALRYE